MFTYPYSSISPSVSNIWPVILALYLLFFSFAIAMYIISSLGLHRIAKGRGMTNGFLAWIPVANTYLLGQITDDINLRAYGKKTCRRALLLGLEIGIIVMYVIMTIVMVSLYCNRYYYHYSYGYDYVFDIGGFILMILFFALAVLAAAITYLVFYYRSLYCIYKDYNPQSSVLFLVLSIFLSVTQPFFLLSISKRQPMSFLYPGYGNAPFNGYHPVPDAIPQEPSSPASQDDFPPVNMQ